MDTQTLHPSVDAHDHKVASSHVEEEGDHHEKKSVFKRVKAKAKQLRDTITNYGHGHPEPDHDHVVHNPDDHDLDEEEDDEDDEMVEDPKVHGAPKYDSAVVNSAIPGHQKNSESVGDSTCMPQDDHKSRTDKAAVELNDPIRGYDTRQSVATFGEGHKEPINIPLSFSPGHRENLENDPRRTVVPGSGESEPRVNLQRPMGLEEDPASPKGAHHPRTPPNYQTKVTDPTGSGAEEVGVNQILGSFDKMNIYDQSEPSKQTSPQNLSHGNVDTSNLSYGEKDNRTRERHQTMQENQQTINPESNPHENEAERSSYTDKIASAASAIADTAISTKNIVVSKLGYGEKDNTTGHEVHRNENSTDSTSTAKSAASSTADYGEKIAAATITEKPSSVDEKVAGAGGDVMSKMQGTGNNESDKEEGKVGQDKGVSIKSYIVEKLRPGEEDRALSQVISNALQPHNELSSTSEAESKPKVTESEEVKIRLGSDEDTNPVSQSYVEMLKGTVDSWLGRGGQTPQGSQESLQGKQGKSGCASGEAEDFSHDNNGHGTRGEN